jgi:hypothetical protein
LVWRAGFGALVWCAILVRHFGALVWCAGLVRWFGAPLGSPKIALIELIELAGSCAWGFQPD